MKPKPRVNNVDATICEKGQSAIFQQHSIYVANYDSDYDEFDYICVAIISDSDNVRDVEPVKVNIRIGNTETKAFVDSWSVCTFIYRSLANAVVSDCQESFWRCTK